VVGKTKAPMTGENIWRLCKVYGRLIGCPTLKPPPWCRQHHDPEEVRALLGDAHIDISQIYASI
jgi:hypothetical protein